MRPNAFFVFISVFVSHFESTSEIFMCCGFYSGFNLEDGLPVSDELVQLRLQIIPPLSHLLLLCLWVFPIVCPCVHLCQNNSKNTLFPARLDIRSAFCSLLFSAARAIQSALKIIGPHHCVLACTTVN